MAVTEYANIPTGTVTAGGTTAPSAGTVESWTVTAATAFPVASSSATYPTQFHVCDPAATSEQILVTVAPGGTGSGQSWTVTRGAEGTTPVAHAAGFTIYQVVTAGDLAQIAHLDWLNVVTMFGADPTGTNDSTTAIQAAINALGPTGGVVYLPTGTYKISSALTLSTQVVLQGDGMGQSFSLGTGTGPTVIKQTSTTAHGIYQNDATQTGIRDLALLGPSSGSGDGIHLTWTSNTNVFQVDLRNVLVTSFGGNGLYANTLLGTQARMVLCYFNGGDGIHLVNGTSCTWDACACGGNTGYGWYVSGIDYCTWNGCAADANANGWYFTGCQSVTLNGCGTEQNTTDGLTLHDGFAYTVNGFWVSNHHYGVHVASGCFGATLTSITEQALSGAVYSIYAESGSSTVILQPSVQTAINIPETWGNGYTVYAKQGVLLATSLTSIYPATVGGIIAPCITATSNYTLNSSEADFTILLNGSSLTATLPTAVGIQGEVFTVKNINNSGATVATTSSQTIDGGLTVSLAQNQSIAVQSDGANWWIVWAEGYVSNNLNVTDGLTAGGITCSGFSDFGSMSLGQSSQSGNFTIGSFPSVTSYLLTAASITATLNAANAPGSFLCAFTQTASGTSTIAAGSGDNIDGNASITLAQHQSVILQSDGTHTWNILGAYGLGTFTGGTLTSELELAAGTTSLIPLLFQSGTLNTSPSAGAMEYDGADTYITNDTTSGRGLIPVEQKFRLTATGGTITSIANFFGSNSNISLVSGAEYEIEIDAWFLKNTSAGTVTWTFTNSAAPTSMNLEYKLSPVAGIVSTAAATALFGEQYNITSAAPTVVSGSLTASVNHHHKFWIRLINGTGTSLKIQAATSASSITPGINSSWKCRRVPAANVGTFSA